MESHRALKRKAQGQNQNRQTLTRITAIIRTRILIHIHIRTHIATISTKKGTDSFMIDM